MLNVVAWRKMVFENDYIVIESFTDIAHHISDNH